MSKRVIIVLLFLVCAHNISGAQPVNGWMNFYPEALAFNDIYSCVNGDLIACGFNSREMVVTRISTDGNEIWRSVVNPEMDGLLWSLVEADNEDIVVGGQLNNCFAAARLNADGEVLWLRSYELGICYSVIELKNGNFAFAGATSQPTIARLIVTNGEGAPILDRSYQRGDRSFFSSMRESDNGIVLLGYIAAAPMRQRLLKVDNNGDQEWAVEYNQFSPFYGGNLLVTVDDGFAFLIEDAQTHPGIARTNLHGEILWWVLYDEFQFSGVPAIVAFENAGFFITGGSLNRDGRALGLCVNNAGELIWHSEYDNANDEEFYPAKLRGLARSDRALYAAGAGSRRAGEGSTGFVMEIGPITAHPSVLRWSPFDTLQTLLTGDSTLFSVYAEDDFGRELSYEWFAGDARLENIDTLMMFHFPAQTDTSITCHVQADQSTISVRWHVVVRDLFIASHSPDTLSLALRRGSIQTFSLDSVAVVDGDPPTYQWTLTDLNSFEAEDTGEDTGVTIDFLRSGNFQLEGLAYRGESSDNVIWSIAVRSAILDFWPRELNLSVLPDSAVNFGVLPFDPESDSLNYSWFVDGELAGQDSTLTWWFAPGDSTGDFSRRYVVSAIVLDGSDGDTVAWTVSVRVPDEVSKSESPKVEKFELLSAYPNPFNSTTTIRFTVPSSSSSSLSLFDTNGRIVRRLSEGVQTAGEHSVTIDGLQSGIYLVALETPEGRAVKKVVCVR